MGQLPAERINPSFSNEIVSVEYAGPTLIKGGAKRRPTYQKTYVAIFVCLQTKSCHVELVSNLTAEAFVAVLRRFVSRGKPCQIWSDNAQPASPAPTKISRNSTVTYKKQKLKQTSRISVPHKILVGNLALPQVQNGVKACKHHLKRIVGQSKLNFEELSTVLCQIEACLNSRLIAASVNTNDDDGIPALTPGDFLIGRPLEALPDHPDITKKHLSMLERWYLCQALVQHLVLWSTEYLNGLPQANKWKYRERNLAVGDIVLIKDKSLTPCKWPLTRITKVQPGPDKLVRIVTLKTKQGICVRPIVKVCLLLHKEQQTDVKE